MSEPFEVLDFAQGGDQTLGRITDGHLLDSKRAQWGALQDMLTLIHDASGPSAELALLDEEALIVTLDEAVRIKLSIFVLLFREMPRRQRCGRRRRRRGALDRVRQEFKVGIGFLWRFEQGARLDAVRGGRDQSAVNSRGSFDAVLPLSAQGRHLRSVWNLFKMGIIIVVDIDIRSR